MPTDVVSLTEALVRVDSSPGRPTRPALALLVDRLRRLGAHVALQSGQHEGVEQHNLVARLGGDGPAGLLLAGHIDTVPWQAGQRATTAPERDGRSLYGRGTCDMKGAIAAQVLAVAASASRLRRPVVLAYTYAEEVGCHGALQLVAQAAQLGDLGSAGCLVGEPTGLVPILAHKGYLTGQITLHGVPVHSSDPEAGVDASIALGVLLRDLHALRIALAAEAPPDSTLAPPCTTLNTGLVQAGAAPNVVPGRASLVVELRPLPGADIDELRARVEACVDLAGRSTPGVRCECHWDPLRPAFAQPAEAALVSWLVEQTQHPPASVAFYTEAELYRSGLQIPTVICGPGSIAAAHRVDESVAFDELEAGQALYERALEAFCG